MLELHHGTGLCPRLHMPASCSLPVWGSETPSGDFYLICDPDSSSDVVMHTPSSPQHPAFLPPLPFLPRLSLTQPPCNSHTGLLLTGSHTHQACLPQSLYTCCSLCLELPDYPVPSLGLASAHVYLLRETFSPLQNAPLSCPPHSTMILFSPEESPITKESMCLIVSPLEGGLGAQVQACSPYLSPMVWKSRVKPPPVVTEERLTQHRKAASKRAAPGPWHGHTVLQCPTKPGEGAGALAEGSGRNREKLSPRGRW